LKDVANEDIGSSKKTNFQNQKEKLLNDFINRKNKKNDEEDIKYEDMMQSDIEEDSLELDGLLGSESGEGESGEEESGQEIGDDIDKNIFAYSEEFSHILKSSGKNYKQDDERGKGKRGKKRKLNAKEPKKTQKKRRKKLDIINKEYDFQ